MQRYKQNPTLPNLSQRKSEAWRKKRQASEVLRGIIAELWFKKCGFPLRSDGTVDWYTLKNEKPDLWEYYHKEIQNTVEHKRYIQIAWQREQPFDEVNNRLKELVSFIATLLV